MRRLATFLLLALCGSCVSGTAAPGDNPLISEFAKYDLTPGPKVLELGGADFFGDSAGPGCVRAKLGQGDLEVFTLVDLELRAGKWVAKSISPSDGDLTLSLQSVGPAIGRHTVSGTITGTAISSFATGSGANLLPTRNRISFDSSSAQDVEGDGDTIGIFVQGKILGTSTFTDTTGAQATCGHINWTMQALPPGF